MSEAYGPNARQVSAETRATMIAAWRERHPEATCSDDAAWRLIWMAISVGREM